MPEKLKKLVAAYEELEQKLGDPAVIADPKEYARLAKEHADQAELVAKAREYLQAIEDIEAARPEPLVEAQPFMRARQRPRFQAAKMRAPLYFPPDQPRALKRLDVLGGRRQRDRKGLGQLPDRARAPGQFAQHPPPRPVAERMKQAVEPLCV